MEYFGEGDRDLGAHVLSKITILTKYARVSDEITGRKEGWKDIVKRCADMHLKKFPELHEEIDQAFEYVKIKRILPSMRTLQFGGLPIDINPARAYNCAFASIDHPHVFGEIMFLLLSGVGVGFSVQKEHVAKLPSVKLANPSKHRRFLIQDSIEGWSDAVKALMKSHFNGTATIRFDYRAIRRRGALLKTAGGCAPGHESLQNTLTKIENVLEKKSQGDRLTPLECHDIVCLISSAVLSGGVRRSALISLFSPDDDEMFTCKAGNFYERYPERCFANNSCVFLRSEIDRSVFMNTWHRIFQINNGEPGVYITNDRDVLCNPCAEISLHSMQFCNLVEIDAAHFSSDDRREIENDFYQRCRKAAFIATLQASYTDFHYLRSQWKHSTEKEALIGVGLTGLASNALSEEALRNGARIVKEENERVSKIIGIRPAARCTTIKPSGTTSIVMNTSNGISAHHDRFYIRRIRLNTDDRACKDLREVLPGFMEPDVVRRHDTWVLSVPMRAGERQEGFGVVVRDEETAVQFLERVKKAYGSWIVEGHRKGPNTNNVSATCNVKKEEEDDVLEWLYDNREHYHGITVFPYQTSFYQQLPFEGISEETFEDMVLSLKTLKEDLLARMNGWESSDEGETKSTGAFSADTVASMMIAAEPCCSGPDTCQEV